MKVNFFLLILLCCLGLCGCVKYDVGVEFDNPHRGQFVQTIELGDQLKQATGREASDWLRQMERKARRIGGSVSYQGGRGWRIVIPFDNASDLITKFNGFFEASGGGSKVPLIESRLSVVENNFVFAVRCRLVYDLNLESLGVASDEGGLLVSPNSVLDVRFSLRTPWGVKVDDSMLSDYGLVVSEGGRLVSFRLALGRVNHLEAVFWLPSPIGVATPFIVLMSMMGFYLKYRHFPGLPGVLVGGED